MGERGLKTSRPIPCPAHEVVHVGVEEEQVRFAGEHVWAVENQGPGKRLDGILEPIRTIL